MFSCKTYKHSQNTFFTQHYRWLLLNTPNHVLNFNKKNKVNYIKLNKHAKTFIMSITLLKGPFWDFLIRKLSRKFSSFLNLIASVSWTTKLNTPALLPTFQCAGGDGNASGFIKYFNLSRGETALAFDFHQRNLYEAPHSKLVEEFRRISNFTCIGLLRVYQTIVLGDVIKKMKIKVVKNMILHASSDILASLGESLFQIRKYYFRHEHWSLVTLKIWSISAKYWVQEPENSFVD